MNVETVFKEIERLRGSMTDALMELVRIPAIAPENGGDGELIKAEKLVKMLESAGFEKIEQYDAEDSRVSSRKRPNIVARYSGEVHEETLWIVSHLDIVPPGEESLWTMTKPFEPMVKDGKIYGRGSEDNIQAIISSLFAVVALKNLGIQPKRTVALCFVADEEQGSVYGIQHLIKLDLFRKNDLVIVPDGGNEDGSFIEIAEKSVLWIRIRTSGKQTHASRPGEGLNANRVGMNFALALDNMLHEKYPASDRCFDPPESTFEPTRKDKNVDAVNIVPGEDVGYFDCRVLPQYDVEEVLTQIADLAKEHEKRTGATIKLELVQKIIAPKPTDQSAKVVAMLKEALEKARHLDLKIGGIGGGTCAAYFRKIDVPAVVWSTVDEKAHQPNEYAKIQNVVEDAKIFAYLAAR